MGEPKAEKVGPRKFVYSILSDVKKIAELFGEI